MRLRFGGRVNLVVGKWTPPPAPTPLRFSIANAAGLALGNGTATADIARVQTPLSTAAANPDQTFASSATGTSGTSNLYAVSSSGQLTQAVSSGSASVSRFFIAPNGDVYVSFSPAVDLADTAGSSTPCLLAQVDPSTGTPTCIDSSLSTIAWPQANSGAQPPIQFDGSGRIYYAGYTSDGSMILRRYSSGTTTDLITTNVRLNDFLVLPDGTVFLSGQTPSTGAGWVRRLSPSGALQSVVATPSSFLNLFPDGNVYMGIYGSGTYGVERFLTASDGLDPLLWIGANTSNPPPPMNYNVSAFCPQAGNEFCGGFGTFIRQTFTTSGGSVYAVTGNDAAAGPLMQYFPTVKTTSSAVQVVDAAQAVGDKIALAGVNASGQNILTLYDPASDSETQLIGPDHEIQIYHLGYDASQNALVFDGLRFSDNTYIVGKVDLATGAVTVGQTLNGQLQDLQTF
jgi:hypothetical protein